MTSTAVAETSPSGGARTTPDTGNVSIYYSQLKFSGQPGDDTNVYTASAGYQPCAASVCGGYKPIRFVGRHWLSLWMPSRDLIVEGSIGYTSADGTNIGYPNARWAQLQLIPLTIHAKIQGRSEVFHLSYAAVQLYDPHQPSPADCYVSCGK